MNNMQADIEIKKAAELSLVEICLGSIGHGLKLPLTGQILSLNQLGFLLNLLNKYNLPRVSVFEVSAISAVLKSFSPAGQKLGPMLSISMQGFLFWFSTVLFSRNFFGQIIGAIFLALWAFIQPAMTFLIVYGFEIFNFYELYQKKFSTDYLWLTQSLYWGFILLISFKIMLAVGFVIYSYFFQKEIILIEAKQVERFLKNRKMNKDSNASAFVMAIKDMTRPLFLISFIILLFFVFQVESNLSQKIWLALRPLGTAFLLFYLVRSPWIEKKLFDLSKKSKSFERIYLKSKKTLDLVAQRSSRSSEISSRR